MSSDMTIDISNVAVIPLRQPKIANWIPVEQ